MNALQHYGIKGMKWGVRRTPEQLGHVKRSRKSKSGYVLGQSYDRDITFPKGSKSYRVQAKTGISNGPLYVSYSKSDHVQYLNTAINRPEYGIAVDAYKSVDDLASGKAPSLYSVEFEAKEEIKIPSFQNAMKIFIELVGDKKISNINPYNEDSVRGQNFIKNWNKRGKLEYGPSYAYTAFVDNLRRPSKSEIFSEFRSRLESEGYNALVDPEDKVAMTRNDEYLETFKAPIIILNPKKTLKISSSKKLTDDDLRYIGSNYDTDFGEIDLRSDDKMSDVMKKTHAKWKQWYTGS